MILNGDMEDRVILNLKDVLDEPNGLYPESFVAIAHILSLKIGRGYWQAHVPACLGYWQTHVPANLGYWQVHVPVYL